MFKQPKREIRAIKIGLLWNSSLSLWERIKYLDPLKDIGSLRVLTIELIRETTSDKQSKGIHNNKLDELQCVLNLKLIESEKRTNYIPQFLFAVISSILSTIAILYGLFLNYYSIALDLSEGMENVSREELSSTIGQSMNQCITELANAIVIIIGLLFAGACLIYVFNRIKVDAIIYYTFVLDCIDSLKKQVLENKNENNTKE